MYVGVRKRHKVCMRGSERRTCSNRVKCVCGPIWSFEKGFLNQSPPLPTLCTSLLGNEK